MPLVQVKCTNCGANLEIDNTLDAAVCPYCNVPFVVEKAINNYNTANHISAGPVNAYGAARRILRSAAACWKSTTARPWRS